MRHEHTESAGKLCRTYGTTIQAVADKWGYSRNGMHHIYTTRPERFEMMIRGMLWDEDGKVRFG